MDQAEARRRAEVIIDPRKCVHIKLPSELHAEIRIFAFKKSLSLQEILTEFCQLIVDGDAYTHRRMDDLVKRKKEKRIKKLTMKDSENIYDYIASQSGKAT